MNDMEMTIWLWTGRLRLTLKDDILEVAEKKHTQNIPLSEVKGIEYTPPKSSWKPGKLVFNLNRSSDMFVTFGMFTGGSGRDFEFFPAYECKEAADAIYKYVLDYLKNKSAGTANGNVIDPADEIRKYKSLADDGIITQEEFEAKKKKLLGL